MSLFIEIKSVEVADKVFPLNTVTFDKDAEDQHCVLVYIERTALKRQSADTLRMQIEGSLIGEDRKNFIFAFSGDSEVITIGVHYNPHALTELRRKIFLIMRLIERYAGISVTVDISTFPKLK